MKTRILFIALLVLVSGKSMEIFADDPQKSINSEVLFFDDFEEPISNDAIFTKWTTENLQGWHNWHIIPGQHMRFENTDLNQNDWLITKPINCAGTQNLKVNFSHLYHANKVPPKLYYTSQYNGHASQSTWKELTYSFGANENQWYQSDDFIIENSGNVIYFAFHYQAVANAGTYFLLDNFSVKSYSTTAPLVLVGSSDHFEFYTNIQDQEGFYIDFANELKYKYNMYKSIWERPSSNKIFPEVSKIKIIFKPRSEIPDLDGTSPNWDCGTFNFQTGEIFISPLDNNERAEYYGTLGKLTNNELAQMALHGWMDEELANWFSEGFGLYEMGYRPNRQQLLNKLSNLGTQEPSLSLLENIDDLPLAGKKDLMASFFQSKVVLHCYFYGFWGDDTHKWWQILKHYYIKEVDRIELLTSTEHFDFYAAAKEIPYIGAMATSMEEQLALQESRFGKLMRHRVNICIYDNEVGKEINNRTDFQGLACGADKINSSHLEINDYGLINHEFMHCWVNMMSPIRFASNGIPIPGQFINEGLAESTGRFMTNEEMPFHNYKIQALYYHYQRKYKREPGWMEIVDNAEVNAEDGFWVDAYALGEMYWRYMNDKYPDNFWPKVRQFLQGARDWTVFGGKSAEQEGAEFIQFMKELAFVGPPLETTSIPYFENFRNDFKNWTLMRYGADDYWRINNDIGFDDKFCAFAVEPYWLEEKEVDSWLVSPPLNATVSESLDVGFRYRQTGHGIKPEIYYTENFTGPTATTNWIPVEGIPWNAAEGQWAKMNFTIANPPEKLFIALRFQSNDGNIASYCIDNFEVKIASPFDLPTIATNEATSESQTSAMLNGAILSDGGTSITQRGFYWSSTNTSPNSGDHVELVAGTTGSFNKTLENLTAGTTYYFRAFAVNSVGTTLGEVKQFKTLATLVLAELPFFADFEETIGAEGIFEKWTAENLGGWHYWHIIPWNGNPGQCMRFENTDLNQNDWLVTKPINCSGAENLKVNFSHLFHGPKIPPRLLYTTQYKGNAIQSVWKELTYSFGENENQWYQSKDISIENPGDVIYFAFHYQAAANAGTYFLLDNFSVEGITTGIKLTALSHSNLKVYPNPKTDKSIVSFTNNNHGNVTLAIYDLKGRQLLTIVNEKLLPGTFTYQINKNDLPNGLYVVRLLTPQEQSVVKLIVTY